MKSKKLTEGILIFYAVMLVWIILFKMDVSVENFDECEASIWCRFRSPSL